VFLFAMHHALTVGSFPTALVVWAGGAVDKPCTREFWAGADVAQSVVDLEPMAWTKLRAVVEVFSMGRARIRMSQGCFV
jgi:hypothetical protein